MALARIAAWSEAPDSRVGGQGWFGLHYVGGRWKNESALLVNTFQEETEVPREDLVLALLYYNCDKQERE